MLQSAYWVDGLDIDVSISMGGIGSGKTGVECNISKQ
jgi:hypothetical protein